MIITGGVLTKEDLKNTDPWKSRCIGIYGIAEAVDQQSGYTANTGNHQSRYIKIGPNKKWAWGGSICLSF